jgi:hypothetical protein
MTFYFHTFHVILFTLTSTIVGDCDLGINSGARRVNVQDGDNAKVENTLMLLRGYAERCSCSDGLRCA